MSNTLIHIPWIQNPGNFDCNLNFLYAILKKLQECVLKLLSLK